MTIGCCGPSFGRNLPAGRQHWFKKYETIGLLLSSNRAKGEILLRRFEMSSETIFRIQLVFGYVAWLLCFRVYLWPWLKAANRFDAQRAIATLHSFRFFGLVFILPGVVGPA